MPLFAQPLDNLALILGKNFRLDVGNAELARDGFGGCAVVAGEHDDSDSRIAQGADRRCGRRLDRVGDCQHASRLAVNRDEDRSRPFRAQILRRLFERRDVDRANLHHQQVADVYRPPVDDPGDALARRRIEVLHRRKRELSLGRGLDDRGGEWMLAALFEACGEPQKIVLANAAEGAQRHDFGLAFRQRARLVDHQRVDLLEPLQSLGVLDQNAGLSAPPDSDHDRHGRGEPERAGTGDDQHRDGRHQAVGELRLRSPDRPGDEGKERDRDHQRHKPAGHLIGKTLDRGAAALSFGDHLHDLRQHRVAPDLVGAHDEASGSVHCSADHLCAGGLDDRHRLAGHHGFVDGASAATADPG